MSRNSGEITDQRNADGTFAKGNPGKPRGSRNKATQAVQGLLDASSGQLAQKAIELGLEGDIAALRLCLERICPPRKDISVPFALPDIKNAEGAARGARAIIEAVSVGDLTPVEGASVMGLIDSFRKTLELTEFEARISKLEAKS